MRIPDIVRKSVVFLGWYNHEKETYLPIGTGFLVNRPYPSYSDRHFVYLITARHVISPLQKQAIETMYIRFNTRQAGAQWIPVPVRDWLFHPTDDGVDVAVLPVQPLDRIFDYACYPFEAFATEEVIQRDAIGIGEEVFMVGLFHQHYGEERNIPIVRAGNIAAMPEEKVKTRLGRADAYLVEVRSIGGLSGSPVFVHLGAFRMVEGKAQASRDGYGKYYLLGLMHGHWDIAAAEVDMVVSDDEHEERINTGIAIVVPAIRIAETINHPKLITYEAGVVDHLRTTASSTKTKGAS